MQGQDFDLRSPSRAWSPRSLPELLEASRICFHAHIRSEIGPDWRLAYESVHPNIAPHETACFIGNLRIFKDLNA